MLHQYLLRMNLNGLVFPSTCVGMSETRRNDPSMSVRHLAGEPPLRPIRPYSRFRLGCDEQEKSSCVGCAHYMNPFNDTNKIADR